MPTTENHVHGRFYLGLFLVTMATLMLEVLLLRIFSVTMWYHFAFMALSIALFGMTVGAVLLTIFPRFFKQERTHAHVAWTSFWFGLSTIVCFALYLIIPFRPPTFSGSLLSEFGNLLYVYAVISIPFIASGIAVSMALTRFPKKTGPLYAADLVGAALGCIILIVCLTYVPAPDAVVLVAAIAFMGGAAFAYKSERRLFIWSVVCACACLAFVSFDSYLAARDQGILRPLIVKGVLEKRSEYERWNSFSRVTVSQSYLAEPFGWGFSPAYERSQKVAQKMLLIDSAAGTPLTHYTGDRRTIQFLKYDIVNLAHHARPNADVLVIGTGGGRDILSALAFDQQSITGVEVNNRIRSLLSGEYGAFTGNLDREPGVSLLHGEGRSFLASSNQAFDIIQVSLIDSWAATAAGAFVLTENSLYTTEGWEVFLSHLTDRGILTFSRWYQHGEPAEIYRLLSLAIASLRDVGVSDPRNHIVLVRIMNGASGHEHPDGIGTILVSRTPFSEDDVAALTGISEKLGFEVIVAPGYAHNEAFAQLMHPDTYEDFVAAYPLNIRPPTDNAPFFFQMLRVEDLFDRTTWSLVQSTNTKAVMVIGMLLIITFGLTLLCIVVPLILSTSIRSRSAPVLIGYFAAIGLGFMLVEVSQMQRLILYLGNPVYGLSVILFTFLLAGGIGSYLSHWLVPKGKMVARGRVLLGVLLALLLLYTLVGDALVQAYAGASVWVRIAVSVLSLAPLALFMGTAFPFGMRLASLQHANTITPLLWGVNGATSVLATVLAYALSLSFGNTAVLWVGVIAYAIAFLSTFSPRVQQGTASPQP